MKRTIKYFLMICITAAFLTSCGNSESLQSYYVDHQEAKNFISQDLPLSMLDIDKTEFTAEQLDAYESVSKLNFLGFKVNADDMETYDTEVSKVKSILSDSKYNELMQFSDKGNKISVKYLGSEEEADEIILFGSSKEMGFGVVRVLGNNMSPDKMVTLISVLQKSNIQEDQIESIMNFFK